MTKSYLELFGMGSSPHQWKTEAPTLQEIRNYLVEQPIRIQKDFAGKLEEEMQQPFGTEDLGPK
ncbi:hypothetical protein ACQCU1_07400 [Sutcliffiella horikoshii]|uniref:hypothetical protein n=1 Tax=Sutcliffiella horikoshii TaxID=79883 RepID=UPI003CEF56BB